MDPSKYLSSDDRFYKMRSAPPDDVDKVVMSCAYEAHKKAELMYGSGQTEIFKDERFTQFMLYEIFCKTCGIDSPEKAGRVVLEYPAELLQPFKVMTTGKPRALDLAINPRQQVSLNQEIPIGIEMKLGANCYLHGKRVAIQSDLIRLSFLRQRAMIHGPCANKCYFIMFGLKEELDGLYLPGLPKDHQMYPLYHKSIPLCWSLSVTKLFDKDMLKATFLDPKREGYLKGFDIVDEVCIKLIADTTSGSPYSVGKDPKLFKTAVKVWTVYMPDPSNGFITE